jgi:hypothetical protein
MPGTACSPGNFFSPDPHASTHTDNHKKYLFLKAIPIDLFANPNKLKNYFTSSIETRYFAICGADNSAFPNRETVMQLQN